MLYKDIRQGCEEYHTKPRAYDKAYEDYMCNKDKDAWRHLDTLPLAESDNLLKFLVQWMAWGPRAKVKLEDFHPALQTALQNVAKDLDPLMDKTILDLDLSKTPIDDNKILVGGDLLKIFPIFDELAIRCKYRGYSSTAASKILHAINPDGFVMWDVKIREKYAQNLLKRDRPLTHTWEYAYYFLPEMQRIANKAIKQVIRNKKNYSRDDAIKWLTPCGNSLAKVIDEYNYVTSR